MVPGTLFLIFIYFVNVFFFLLPLKNVFYVVLFLLFRRLSVVFSFILLVDPTLLPLGCLSSYTGFLISILHVSISLRINFFLKSKDNLGFGFCNNK